MRDTHIKGHSLNLVYKNTWSHLLAPLNMAYPGTHSSQWELCAIHNDNWS